jgi:Flp pilus assembly pilin Flp
MFTTHDLEFARLVTVPALRARLADQRGATMVEYGLVLALVAVVAMVGFTFIGNSTKDNLMCTGGAMTNDTVVDGSGNEYYDTDETAGYSGDDTPVDSCN